MRSGISLPARTWSSSGPASAGTPETMAVVRRLYGEMDKTFVIDADGISAFEGRLDLIKARRGRAVLTPHPGEFGRLIGKSPTEVNADRLELGRRFAEEHGVCLVLKGAPTITFSPEGEAFINPTGNPALSKGGAGDVLTGFIGGLAAQGYTPDGVGLLRRLSARIYSGHVGRGPRTWTFWRGI